MASTYSTNLAIELIGTGEQSGTWGVTTNTNLGTLLEQAISGYVTQAITDGSGANTTITIPNGATGVARNMFIEMTGALTFSTTSLIVPANKKLYFIYNNTTGGFAVTVKVSGQTGVSVPNGKKVILVSNGTDVVNAENYIASLSVGALTSGRVTYASTAGLLTDSSEFLFDGTNVTLGVAVSTTSRMYQALELGASGNNAGLQLGNTGAKGAVYGASGQSGLYIVGGTPGQINFGYSTGNTSLYANYSSLGVWNTTGLGIGTTSTNGKLSIQGTGSYNSTGWGVPSDLSIRSSEMTDNAYHSIIQLASIRQSQTTGSGANGFLGFSTIDDSNNTGVNDALRLAAVNEDGTQGTSPVAMSFWTNAGGSAGNAPTEKMRITSAGLVGIGTTSPVNKLQVNGAVVATGAAAAYAAGMTIIDYGSGLSNITAIGGNTSTVGTMVFQSFSSNASLGGEKMRIDASGNVGIGTAAPSQLLTIVGATNPAIAIIDSTNNVQTNIYSDNTVGYIGTGSSHNFSIKTVDVVRATFDTSGNLLVGTASGSGGARLVIEASTPEIRLMQTGATNISQFYSDSNGLTFGTVNSLPVIIRTGTTEVARITATGRLGIGTSSPSTILQASAATPVVTVTSTGTTASSMDFTSNSAAQRTTVGVEQSGGGGLFVGSSAYAAVFGSAGASSCQLASNNNVRMTIDTSGNVGIGTASPGNVLDVSSSGSGEYGAIIRNTSTNGVAAPILRFYAGSGSETGAILRFASTHGSKPNELFITNVGTTSPITFATQDTERMRIDSSGNVGIGMTPTNFGNGYTVLQVANATNGGMLYLTNTSNVGGRIYGNTAGLTYEAFGALYQAFSTNSTERMRIDSSGNLLVGATSNPNSGKINIDFNGSTTNGIVYNDTANANGTVFAYFTVSGTACGQINRIATTNAVTYASASDRRLKSNIQPITAEQSGSIIDALKPCSFTWNSNNSEDVGFIADEFQTVMPRAVSGQPNGTKEQEYEVTPAVQDEDGNVITPAVMGTKTIPDYQMLEASTAEMIAYLVTEVQSLRKRVAQLEGA